MFFLIFSSLFLLRFISSFVSVLHIVRNSVLFDAFLSIDKYVVLSML